MTDAQGIARKTAKRLTPQFGQALPLAVEKVIHGAGAVSRQFDLGALAALAGIAQLIVQVGYILYELKYKRASGEKLDKEALKRELQHELGLPHGVSEEQLNAVIDAAVAETKDEGEV